MVQTEGYISSAPVLAHFLVTLWTCRSRNATTACMTIPIARCSSIFRVTENEVNAYQAPEAHKTVAACRSWDFESRVVGPPASLHITISRLLLGVGVQARRRRQGKGEFRILNLAEAAFRHRLDAGQLPQG
jgi:hypothetical protein